MYDLCMAWARVKTGVETFVYAIDEEEMYYELANQYQILSRMRGEGWRIRVPTYCFRSSYRDSFLMFLHRKVKVAILPHLAGRLLYGHGTLESLGTYWFR